MKRKQVFGFDYTNNEYMKIFMYLLVGGSAAILEWTLFYIFFRLLTAGGVFSLQTQRVLAATTMAFATSTLYHYILCNRFVFGSRYQRGKEVSLVFLVSTIGLGWNLLLMWLFTSPVILGLNPMLSKIMASAIVTVWNYVSRKKWIFK
ncbi:GtrA family protein [uncultured Megasphaera sp.]|uniref:GtrA family protein n=1 Tax=uncultured Megasphaera sp. TaxID=165188 RepID=UPI00286900BF|nr:GtrA family protein [uncultured Megasphaera sp.]